MDIRKNKAFSRKNIKEFALKATASIIVALNAQTVSAGSCPLYIDTTIAGVCDFDATPSVTVANGGQVDGINMVGQPPASYIAINAGGIINNSTGIGIHISSSSLSNGISNSGTIIAHESNIDISHTSTISGGISNSGMMSSEGLGIYIRSSSLSNGISNSGTISTHGSNIEISQASTISGDISNSGMMSGTNGTGILIQGVSTLNGGISNSGTIQIENNFCGIVLSDQSIIDGGLTNSGLINTLNGNSILIRSNSTLSGGISNSGTISSEMQRGIDVNIANIVGNISNNGVISGGTEGVAIHNASTLNGNVLNNGTISGDLDGLTLFSVSAISGSISNSGMIRGSQNGISISFSAVISGSVSNSGTIRGGQNGISISSNATISGGISNSGTIQGDINAINIANSNVSSIDILGQSSRIIGAVEAPDTTVNITNGATFTSEGSFNVDLFNIGPNALFNMANTITATGVNNSGTLAVSDTLQTIAGDYTQQIGGLFQTVVSSASEYGQLMVTGAIDLLQNGGINVQVGQDTLLHNGDILSDVLLGGSLTAPTNGFNISDNSYIWTFVPQLNSASNGLNLIATINPEAYNVCQGTYCQGAATAILGQMGAGNPIFSPYAVLSTADAFRQAASQATPELINENMQVVQLITRSVMDLVPMWNALRGKSSGDAMLYQPGKIWVKPYGASMTQNQHNTVPGFNATAYGAVIGKDIQLTNDWLFGGGFAAGGDNMRGKSLLSGQSINSQAYQGMLYGAKTLPNHVYIAGQGLVGYEINDTSRSIPLYASTAKGSYNSWFTNLRANAGWSTYALSPNFVFTPEVDASYLYVNQNGYQESGSLMDLLVASNNNSSLVLGAYGNGAYHLANIRNQNDLTLTGYVGFARNMINSQPRVTSTFVAGGAPFSTFGVQFNSIVFRGGVGLALTNATSPLSVELNYDLQAGNNAYSGVGAATIKYKT